MNRRIYYDGALINKIGIDRIVIKKVVLKEINAEKLDTALTCCAIPVSYTHLRAHET